jgi:pseudolysin
MYKHYFLVMILVSLSSAYAAKAINLHHQSAVYLQPSFFTSDQSQLQEISCEEDLKHIRHKRFRQTFAGLPVWGAEVVAHFPANHYIQNKIPMNATIDGLIYQNLSADLKNIIITKNLKQLALQHVIDLFHHQAGNGDEIFQSHIKAIIYVDKNNKAHWSFLINFMTKSSSNKLPAKPTFIVDALNFAVYQQWDGIQTIETILVGGLGGNDKIGQIIYDGVLNNDLSLSMQRDEASKICYFKNAGVVVSHVDKPNQAIAFQCIMPAVDHNNLYWNGSFDPVNGAYSPSNDALSVGSIVNKMYQRWYGIPALTKNGKSMVLHMNVHKKIENAYWDGSQMTFGDGGNRFYPLVSLGVAAHEISHGFTQQHAHLMGNGQSGGLNEAFSDMAAQAVQFYLTGKNNWLIGAEIIKDKNKALRYMNEPTRDCQGDPPGRWCSISQLTDYYDGLDVHYSAGVFNKAFYLLASTPGWDTHKAFDLMVHANRFYWMSQTDFTQAACGVLHASDDLQYDSQAVKKAFGAVGISLITC